MQEEVDEPTRKALQNVARHEMLHRLLADITIDLQVCKLEKWDKMEYINLLKKEIDGIYEKLKGENKNG